MRARSESFADHYSQARQFYISQTVMEQKHISDALTFELSKCEREDIRLRMVSHLLNIHEELAQKVATGLGLKDLPQPADAAVKTRTDLKPSDPLSIIKNGPNSFKGRKLGILMTDGADAALFGALKAAVEAEGGMFAVVAPKVGGVIDSGGGHIKGDEKIDGGPSVVFDAVALLPSEDGAKLLAEEATARDFVSDAFAHCKFIGYVAAAQPLLKAAGIADHLDDGCVLLDGAGAIQNLLQKCYQVRHWEREMKVHRL